MNPRIKIFEANLRKVCRFIQRDFHEIATIQHSYEAAIKFGKKSIDRALYSLKEINVPLDFDPFSGAEYFFRALPWLYCGVILEDSALIYDVINDISYFAGHGCHMKTSAENLYKMRGGSSKEVMHFVANKYGKIDIENTTIVCNPYFPLISLITGRADLISISKTTELQEKIITMFLNESGMTFSKLEDCSIIAATKSIQIQKFYA